jgi:hypothetical protein
MGWRRNPSSSSQSVVKSPIPSPGRALVAWADALGARHAQPEEDHLLPLMVATDEPGHLDFHGLALGKPISGFRFG